MTQCFVHLVRGYYEILKDNNNNNNKFSILVIYEEKNNTDSFFNFMSLGSYSHFKYVGKEMM